MPAKNSVSIQIAVRVKNTKREPHFAHLSKKAIANSQNSHNNLATEINQMIAADYQKSLKAKKKI